jgi:hypothetical protein
MELLVKGKWRGGRKGARIVGSTTSISKSCWLRAIGGWEEGCKRLGSSTSILWSFWLRANGGVGGRVQEWWGPLLAS